MARIEPAVPIERDNLAMRDPLLHASRTLAAIDMGSNSFRLEVGRFDEGRYRRLDYLKETVRLGGGLDENGLLSGEAAQRGLATLARFAQRLAGFAPERVRAVATQTLREARNRDEFLLRARTALGHPIEVISGREEARLIYAGVAQLQPSNRRRLVLDIGGRSTELVLGRAHRPSAAESFQVGSVGLSMRYFADGRLTASAFRAAQIAAGAELEEGIALFRRDRWDEALGSSGTVGAVAQLLAAAGVTDGRLTPAALAWCIERCIEAGHVDALKLPGVKDERRPVIAGGLSVLYTLLVQFGIDTLQPAKGALRHGVITELHERLWGLNAPRSHDVRQDAVRDLQRRFSVDVEQARRVRSVALARFAEVAPLADEEARRELAWAAELHEAGMVVSHHDHHRHCSYLIGRADAAGFSQTQQRRLAELVLGQRGGLKKLPSLADEGFTWQVLCLRLAVIECHAREDVDRHAVHLRRDGRRVQLIVADDWAADHPRTMYLLREEVSVWTRSGGLELLLPDQAFPGDKSSQHRGS